MILASLERFCLDHDLRAERGEDVHVEALRAPSAAAGEHRVEIGGVQTVFWSDDPLGDAVLSGALGAVADDWRPSSRPGPTLPAANRPQENDPHRIFMQTPPRFDASRAGPGRPGSSVSHG